MAGRIQETWLRPISTRQGIAMAVQQRKKKAIHKTIGAGRMHRAASEQRLLSSFTRNLQTMLLHFHFHRYAPCAFTLPAARRFLATPTSLRMYYRVLPVAATRAILSQHERTRMRRDRLGSYYRTLLTRCVIGNVRIRRMV